LGPEGKGRYGEEMDETVFDTWHLMELEVKDLKGCRVPMHSACAH